MLILGIDPGTVRSGVVYLEDGEVLAATEQDNCELLANIGTVGDAMAIEMVGHFGTGMPAGKDIFWTVYWIGRFAEAWFQRKRSDTQDYAALLLRPTIKTHLCGNPKAKDGNVRQALIDRLGPPGTKKNPGPTYGVSGHCWQALAVAVCHADGIAPILPPRKEE